MLDPAECKSHFSLVHTSIARMFGLSAIVLLLSSIALSVATPLDSRDAGGDILINDLLRLDAAIRTITYAAGNYTGGVAQYQPIRESFSEVNRTNRIAYFRAMQIKPREYHITIFGRAERVVYHRCCIFGAWSRRSRCSCSSCSS